MKVCSKCKIEKQKTEFSKRALSKDGFRSECKACHSAQSKKWSEENKEKIRESRKIYRKNNAEKVSLLSRAWRESNKERHSENSRRWYEENKEIIAKRAKCRYEQNKEIKAAAGKLWASKNKEMIYARKLMWRTANPEKISAQGSNRRARKKNAEGRHTAADIQAIFEKQQGLCSNCQTKLFKSGAEKHHVDHIMPLALGGSNWPSNLQCLCPFCNLSKGAKHPYEWAKQQGRLL